LDPEKGELRRAVAVSKPEPPPMPPLPSYVEFTRGFGTHATSLGQLGTSKPTYKDHTNNERAAVRPPYGSLTNHGTDTIRTGTSYGTNKERATARRPCEQRAELRPELRTRTLARASLNYGARPSGGWEHLLAELGWCWRLKAQRAELRSELRIRTLTRASLNYGARPSGGCEHLLAELGWCWRLKAHDEEETPRK